jgi:23S rRNA (cytosine1962-C5)-methyltransferase
MTATLRISRRASDRIRAGHLWVYRTDVESGLAAAGLEALQAGAVVSIADNRGIGLGSALYSTASTIAARVFDRTPGLGRAEYLRLVRERVAQALDRRRQLAPITAANTAHRLLFSEADGLPGIVADRYHELVLVQLLTQGTAQDDVRAVLAEALREGLQRDGASLLRDGESQQLTIWERPDPRIRELEELPAPPPGPLFTTAAIAPTTSIFDLNGLRFHYDAAAGQKTGAFLDQRLNYAAAAAAVGASGRTGRALDICTYQGGFALHLAQVCERVTGVDASRAALEAADRNLALNPQLRAAAQTEWMEADAFEYLRHLDDVAREAKDPAARSEHRFDAIVLDPPAFAKSKRAAEGAMRGYKELSLRAMRLLEPGGTLVTCSCSHHVALEDFTAVVAAAAADAGRRVQLLETRAAAPDHPEVLTLPETRYLKCLICRVE